jgi:ABC-type multidrug transport system fused ATPase/permease subunit
MLKFIPRPIMESVCICGLLGAFAIKMQFSGAQMSSFVSTMAVFVVAAVRMLPSFNRITGNIGSMMFDKPAIDSVYHDLVEIEELMDKRKLTEEADAKIVLNDRLKVDGISFHYPESEEWVLNHANLVIEKNQSVAIIGASGAGKTTMVDIILGLLEPQEGKITVDGIDIWTHMESWHQSIGYIPQSIYLMDDTIRANIAFGVPESDINDDAIAEALVEAQLDQFVASLPEGLDTVIGDRGVKLSGGQRQRIGIARALYRNPEVLILDEATSALDNETEREVMAAIDGLHGQRTMIVIAHRLTTIRNCDAIYEVANGVITRKTYQEVFGDN